MLRRLAAELVDRADYLLTLARLTVLDRLAPLPGIGGGNKASAAAQSLRRAVCRPAGGGRRRAAGPWPSASVRDRPLKGVSHPKECRRLPPLDMLAKPIGATLGLHSP
jgi:hypothetical protein